MANIDAMLQNAAGLSIEAKKGLTQEQLKKLKLITYKIVKKKGEEDICSICLVAARKGDRLYHLVCNHMFHVRCINPWFKKST